MSTDKTMLIFSHAIYDILVMHPINMLLMNDDMIFRRSHIDKEDLHIGRQLDGMINALLLVDRDDVLYGLTWLSLLPLDITFTSSVCEVLRSHIRTQKLYEVRAVIKFLTAGSKLEVRADGVEVPVSIDILEALKNACKYAKSYINVGKRGSTVIVENDVREHHSGTQKGLTLHPLIRFTVTNGVAKAEIDVEESSCITMNDIYTICNDLGFTTVPKINGNTFTGRLAKLAVQICPDLIRLEDMTTKKEALAMISTVLAEHVDTTKPIYITTGVGHRGVDVSVGMMWYGGLDHNPAWYSSNKY